MTRYATAAAAVALALLTFFQFPGHTWLQQDSQIYVPVLEHQRDPSALRNDPLVSQSPVAFTLYDEAALALGRVSGLSFRDVLAAEQIAARAFGIWGLYLMATALGLATGSAWVVTAVCSLGATIAGPSVLTFEYEPTPRALAIPLSFCAVGLAAHQRYLAAGMAAAAGFLYHPPSLLPFWATYVVLAMWPAKSERRQAQLWGIAPLIAAVVILLATARGQPSILLLGRLTPGQEMLQRMRASYVWISMWPWPVLEHYAALTAVVAVAAARIWRQIPFELRVFVLGMAALGMVSMPASWLLLEGQKWALMPQL